MSPDGAVEVGALTSAHSWSSQRLLGAAEDRMDPHTVEAAALLMCAGISLVGPRGDFFPHPLRTAHAFSQELQLCAWGALRF